MSTVALEKPRSAVPDLHHSRKGGNPVSFARYAKYKDSGVEWLGEVPAHWTIEAIKWLSPVMRGASPRPIEDPSYFDDDGQYAWVRISDVSRSDGTLRETTQRLSELGASLSVKLHSGELFVSIAGSVGKPCITDIDACIHDGFVYFPRLTRYRRLLFRIFEAGTCYSGLGKFGTQLNLNTDTIGSIRVALPPSDELAPILRFLDSETVKIDALIAEQEKLIALLKEKCRALISHAVTKGIDPNAPMKDSGIEWLGRVPAHWHVCALKRLAVRITDGAHVSPETEDGIFDFVSTKDVEETGIDFDHCLKTSPESYQYMVRTGCQPQVGDVLFSKDGTIGRTIVIDHNREFVVASSLIIIRPDHTSLDAGYLHYLGQSCVVQEQVQAFVKGAGLPRLSIQNLKKVVGVFPPLNEQQAIVQALNGLANKFVALRSEAESAIELLKERRAALISAAVTGKIDVRNVP